MDNRMERRRTPGHLANVHGPERRAGFRWILLLVVVFGCGAAARAGASGTPRPPGFAPLPQVRSPRLYVIDCGTLVYNRPEDYRLTREEVADTNMAVPCFLVIHPRGILLFDTGLSDRLVGRTPLRERR